MSTISIRGWLAVTAAVLAACSGGDGHDPLDAGAGDGGSGCAVELADGTCAGVTRSSLCAGAFCTAGVSCVRVLHVQQGAKSGDGSSGKPYGQLQQAAAAAKPGDCIAVGAGAYGPATLQGGVSLLGQGAGGVSISSGKPGDYALRVEQGQGGTIRGVALRGPGRGLLVKGVAGLVIEQTLMDGVDLVGLDARQATKLALRHVHLRGAAAGASGKYGFGVQLKDWSDVTLEGSVVEQSASVGLLVLESALTLEASAVRRNSSYGVAVRCLKDARCKATLRQALVDDNTGVGLWARVERLRVEGCDIGRTRLGAGVGRNVELAGAAAVVLEQSTIHHAAMEGLVWDTATGTISGNTIADNGDRGVWLQNVTAAAGLQLTDNVVARNSVTGVGATACKGVTISGGRIEDTKLKLQVSGSSTVSLGDGLQALGGAEIAVKQVQLEGHARVGVLIDAAKTAIADSVIDAAKAKLVVQNADLKDQTFSNNKDAAGGPVTAIKPTTDFVVSSNPAALIGSLPLPIP